MPNSIKFFKGIFLYVIPIWKLKKKSAQRSQQIVFRQQECRLIIVANRNIFPKALMRSLEQWVVFLYAGKQNVGKVQLLLLSTTVVNFE